MLPRTLGFIGLGQMGSRMARNLLKAGHNLIVYDALPTAAETLGAGMSSEVVVAASPADLVSRLSASGSSSGSAVPDSMRVVTMLPNSEHVRSVLLGAHGLLSNREASRGLALIDCSTIDPAVAKEAGRAMAGLGTFVDAPVSGGVVGAENATLTFMVGGDSDGVEQSRPLLSLMGKSVVHCGPVGSGQAAKLCNNLVLAVSMAGVAEGMLLGQRLGVDKQARQPALPRTRWHARGDALRLATCCCRAHTDARHDLQHLVRSVLVLGHLQPMPGRHGGRAGLA